jgi:hypothetical protein
MPANHNAALRVPQESQVEGRKYQDDPDVHYQPLPKPVPKEKDIYTDNNGCQRCNVKQDRHLSGHSTTPGPVYS